MLLDYSKGGNKRFDVSNPIHDYIVQVDLENPDLYLGKAYYALGPIRVMSDFFILERHRRGFTNYATRHPVGAARTHAVHILRGALPPGKEFAMFNVRSRVRSPA